MYVPQLSIAERYLSAAMAASLPALLTIALTLALKSAGDSGGETVALTTFSVPIAASTPQPEPEPDPAPSKPGKRATSDGRAAQITTLVPQLPPVPAPLPSSIPLSEQAPVFIAPAMPAAPAARDSSASGPADSSQASDSKAAGSGAKAGGGASAGQKAEDAYAQAVLRKIRAKQAYPRWLARRGGVGTVLVEIIIDHNGRLADVVVIAGSGEKEIDRLALNHVRAAGPFGAPPGHAQRIFRIPMTYRPRKA